MKNRANAVQALISNWSQVEKATDAAYNSAGTASKEQEVWMQSIDGYTNKLKASWQVLSNDVLDSDVLKGGISAITGFVDALDLLVDKAGILGTVGIGKFFLDIQHAFVSSRNDLKAYKNEFKAFAQMNSANMGYNEAYNLAASNKYNSLLKTRLVTLGAIAVAVGTTVAAYKAFEYQSLKYTRAKNKSEEASSDYKEEESNLQSLTDQYDTQKQKIEELNKLKTEGKITLAQQDELHTLTARNEALEQQIEMQKNLVKIKAEASASSAVSASNTEKSILEQRREELGGFWGTISGIGAYFDTRTDPTTGLLTSSAFEWKQKDTTETGLIKFNLEQLKQYETELDTVKEKLVKAPDDSELLQQQTDLVDKISTTKNALADSAETLQGWIDASKDSNGKIYSANIEKVNEWNDALLDIQNYGLSDEAKALNEMNAFFTGSTGKNALKKRFVDAVKSGKSLESEMKRIGLSLKDIGRDVNLDMLSRYFDELAKSATDASDAVDSIDSLRNNNNGTIAEIGEAFSSTNAGDAYVSLADYMDKAKELYDQGLTGTDDFLKTAEALTYGLDSTAESFATNYEKMQRYITKDSNGNYSAEGIQNFLTDIQALGKGYAEFNEESGKWNINMENTAQVAKELGESIGMEGGGMGVQAFESMLGRIQDYDNLGEFKFTSAISEFNDAKDALSRLESVYDSLDDNDPFKDSLKGNLEDWREQIKNGENDLASLPKEVVTRLKFEADRAELKKQRDEAEEFANKTGNVTNNAEALTYAEEYRDTLFKGVSDASLKKIPIYFDTQNSIDDLYKQLESVTDEGQRVEILGEITNLTDMQSEILEGFLDTHPNIDFEANPTEANKQLQEWAQSVEGQEYIANVKAKFDEESNQRDIQEKVTNVAKKVQDEMLGKNDVASFEVDAELNTEKVDSGIKKIEDKKPTVEAEVKLNTKGAKSGTKGLKASDVNADLKLDTSEAENKVNAFANKEIPDLEAEITGKDNYTSTVNDYENLTLNPKTGTLDVEDNASPQVEYLNGLTLEEKNALLTATDNATPQAQAAEASIESVEGKDVTISATDNATVPAKNASGALNSIPSFVSSYISVTAGGALGVIASVKNALSNIPRSVTTVINTIRKTSGDGKLNGTAHLGGTSYSSGNFNNNWIHDNWRTKKSENALVGEEGEELVATRENRFYTVGSTGAEFVHIPKGSVVFNAKQTKELLTKGHINGRGRAFLSGTNYLGSASGGFNFTGGVSRTSYSSPTVNNYNVSVGGSGVSSSSTSSDASEEFKETIDWIEVAINRIERIITSLDTKAKSVYNSWTVRNSALKDQITQVSNELDLQSKAYDRYIEQANSVGLSEDWAQKVRDGKIDIETITDEDLNKRITEYKEWYDKALDCKDAIDKLNESLSELYKQSFDNVETKFKGILARVQNRADSIDEIISQNEQRGRFNSTKYYSELIANEKWNIAYLEKQRSEMSKAFTEAVQSGTIAAGSEAWWEMQNALDDITLSIDKANTKMLEYSKTIREIQWEVFDYIQERISDINDESEFLINLMKNDKLYDDKGKLTNQGMATMGLHAVEYNTYMQQADKYASEIKKIEKEIAKDPYNKDLVERKQELLKLQRESILNAEEEKVAIRDLVEDGIDKELESLKKLIDEYEESLDVQKDLYDHQKKTTEQTEKIASLQKQLSAYSGDTSEEAKSTIQKLEVSLKDAQADLEETQYDKYVSDQKKLLDNLYDEYEEILNKRLDNLDKLVSDMITEVNKNSGKINSTIKTETKAVGYTISTDMSKIWNGTTGVNKIVSVYGDKFFNNQTAVSKAVGNINTNVSKMITNLDKLANEIGSVGKVTQVGDVGDSSTYDTSKNISVSYSKVKKGGHKTGISKIQKDELAWTQEGYIPEAIIRPSDGAILTPLKTGDAVLNGMATANLYDMMNNPSEFIRENMLGNQLADGIPSVINTSSSTSVNLDNITFNLPNVMNYDDFLYEMQHDSKFEKLVKAMTIDRAFGGSSLKKYRI